MALRLDSRDIARIQASIEEAKVTLRDLYDEIENVSPDLKSILIEQKYIFFLQRFLAFSLKNDLYSLVDALIFLYYINEFFIRYILLGVYAPYLGNEVIVTEKIQDAKVTIDKILADIALRVLNDERILDELVVFSANQKTFDPFLILYNCVNKEQFLAVQKGLREKILTDILNLSSKAQLQKQDTKVTTYEDINSYVCVKKGINFDVFFKELQYISPKTGITTALIDKFNFIDVDQNNNALYTDYTALDGFRMRTHSIENYNILFNEILNDFYEHEYNFMPKIQEISMDYDSEEIKKTIKFYDSKHITKTTLRTLTPTDIVTSFERFNENNTRDNLEKMLYVYVKTITNDLNYARVSSPL
jgi:hypothetical protein